ncbi:MAG: hypothetical protein Sapg2KO_46220 [Saprospiraceae bacterium]
MKSTFLKLSVLLCLLLPFQVTVFAKQVPPKSNQLVTDYIGLLSSTERLQLERKLVAYDDTSSTQIAVVIENSLEGDDVFEYSYRLAESWGIGQDGKDNGILVYIAFQDRQLYIQTGYGTEGFLTDAMAKRIIDQVITPAFRQQNYFRGLDEATTVIMQLGSGEYQNEGGQQGNGYEALFILFLIVVAVVIFFSVFGNDNDDYWDDDGGYNRRGRYDYDDYNRPRGRRRSRSGGWIYIPGGGGGWNSGGGGGGFGGGGFGGFGGGGFGGGGAGGSW